MGSKEMASLFILYLQMRSLRKRDSGLRRELREEEHHILNAKSLPFVTSWAAPGPLQTPVFTSSTNILKREFAQILFFSFLFLFVCTIWNS